MRVLIVKMSSLGDVVHTLPALSDAAAAIPGITFDWVVEEALAEIPAWHPAVSRVIPVALRRWRKKPLKYFGGSEWRKFSQALGRNRYDAVIDAQGLLKSAFIARLVKAPRYGMDKYTVRERWAALVYHHEIEVPKDMHAVERSRMLFASALGYSRPEGLPEYGVRAKLKANSDKLPASLLFFHGTARAEKLWPEDYWIALATLAGAQGYHVWLPWGSEEERARARRIAASCSNAEVLPRLDLRGLASMLLEVDGAVAVDTGLGHLSAALDVPMVSLYGPTSTKLVGAYGRNQTSMQSPLGPQDSDDPLAMMASIPAEQVWRELVALLAQS